MATKRLGKGLEALIRPFEETNIQPSGVRDILISSIKVNPNQPRKDGLNKESLEELTASIKEKGVITPIIVQQTDDGLMIVAGERRWRSATIAGLKKIPTYIIDVANDAELMEMALIENIQRENLNALEEAEAFAVLQNEFNLNQAAIAKSVGKKRVTITNSMRLLNLPTEIKLSLRKGEISAGHGRAILSVNTTLKQKKLWQRILKEKLSVRAVEDIVKSTPKIQKLKMKKARRQKSASLRSIENELIGILGTKVQVKSRGSKGSLEIEYFSHDDLERIMDLLRGIDT